MDDSCFKEAFYLTWKKRNTTQLKDRALEIIDEINLDKNLRALWDSYTKKYDYSKNISFDEVVCSLLELINRLK